ncbi:MAG TPA: undecaprenyldiphospho-muramoylpentapeptide beta-N-acetylglucosaminyltransferase [Candidatus Acidoferrales bacterium]|nr:undecaprenyldiphospho-muramoylpentapeptide beta-N-acetylglucosaminyltransferase [Candidatus Acidoferrales bacterium]
MNSKPASHPLVAIACGGTGGHLFPGLAVAGELKQNGCEVALLISPKEVDQEAVKSASGLAVFTLPAVGLQNRNYFTFAGNFVRSLFAARKAFRQHRPEAVLAMGGFTSAPPIFVAKELGARTFLHESNTVPGKANRYLAHFVDEVFVGFPETAARLKARAITHTGTPVRAQFSILDADGRVSAANHFGFKSDRPVVLVMGGSQGASGLNAMVLSALPLLAPKKWQWLHLTGVTDFEKAKSAYAAVGLAAVVKPFLAEMDLALGLATAAVSRAGASSLAEIAAVRLPALLVPFPAAADNHQFFNAQAYAAGGAARLLEQKDSTPEKVAAVLVELVENGPARVKIMAALEPWHAPQSAVQIATGILRRSGRPTGIQAKGADDLARRPLGSKNPSTA